MASASAPTIAEADMAAARRFFDGHAAPPRLASLAVSHGIVIRPELSSVIPASILSLPTADWVGEFETRAYVEHAAPVSAQTRAAFVRLRLALN
jgi:hypothetical protein